MCQLKILMFGWEFPPRVSGGLGTACYGITQSLSALGHKIFFVVPKVQEKNTSFPVTLISASEFPVPKLFSDDHEMEHINIAPVDILLKPYITEEQYTTMYRLHVVDQEEHVISKTSTVYGSSLFSEVVRYSKVANVIAGNYDFDVIHAHDWLTVLAGVTARKISGKPLIFHIHSLEYDRSGEHINRQIYEIERFGLMTADHIIAASHYTKNRIVTKYEVPPDKISVVHNAVSQKEIQSAYRCEKNSEKKIVLFLGRITFQKGPEYFLDAASLVLQKLPGTTFIMAGTGDLMPRMVEKVAELGIGKSVHFTGFLDGSEVERIFAMSDVYVMPSVSEPFGITALESMIYDVPVILSRQSGVSEVIHHALMVDFWDAKEIANKIIAVLKYPALVSEMSEKAKEEIKKIHWNITAQKIVEVYTRMGA